MQQDDHIVYRNKKVQDKKGIALKTRLTEGDTFGILSVNRRHDCWCYEINLALTWQSLFIATHSGQKPLSFVRGLRNG
jgi:hypothetical protein